MYIGGLHINSFCLVVELACEGSVINLASPYSYKTSEDYTFNKLKVTLKKFLKAELVHLADAKKLFGPEQLGVICKTFLKYFSAQSSSKNS